MKRGKLKVKDEQSNCETKTLMILNALMVLKRKNLIIRKH